jgi:hypothetical protein
VVSSRHPYGTNTCSSSISEPPRYAYASSYGWSTASEQEPVGPISRMEPAILEDMPQQAAFPLVILGETSLPGPSGTIRAEHIITCGELELVEPIGVGADWKVCVGVALHWTLCCLITLIGPASACLVRGQEATLAPCMLHYGPTALAELGCNCYQLCQCGW